MKNKNQISDIRPFTNETYIRKVCVNHITNSIGTIDTLKEILDYFEGSGLEYLNNTEKELRDSIYSKINRLLRSISEQNQIVNYDYHYGKFIKELYKKRGMEEQYKKTYPNGHIREYIEVYHSKKYDLDYQNSKIEEVK